MTGALRSRSQVLMKPHRRGQRYGHSMWSSPTRVQIKHENFSPWPIPGRVTFFAARSTESLPSQILLLKWGSPGQESNRLRNLKVFLDQPEPTQARTTVIT